MSNGIDSILALDLATHCGWAWWEADAGAIVSGRHDLSSQSGHPGLFRNAAIWISEQIKQLAPAVIAIEQPIPGKFLRDSIVCCGLYGAVLSECRACQVATQVYPPAKVKKTASGKGNASKAAVRAAIRARGYVVDSNDEADAVAVLLTAAHELEVTLPKPRAPMLELAVREIAGAAA